MALHQAIIGAAADLIQVVVSMIARKFGCSEGAVKKIESYIFWLLGSIFISMLLVVTIKYS